MSMSFMSMPFIWAKAGPARVAESKAIARCFISASFRIKVERLLHLRGWPRAELAAAYQEIGCWNNEHGKQRRRQHAADHRCRDSLHHFGAGAAAEHDGHKARDYHCYRHRDRPDAQRRAVDDRVAQILAGVEAVILLAPGHRPVCVSSPCTPPPR